MLLVEMY